MPYGRLTNVACTIVPMTKRRPKEEAMGHPAREWRGAAGEVNLKNRLNSNKCWSIVWGRGSGVSQGEVDLKTHNNVATPPFVLYPPKVCKTMCGAIRWCWRNWPLAIGGKGRRIKGYIIIYICFAQFMDHSQRRRRRRRQRWGQQALGRARILTNFRRACSSHSVFLHMHAVAGAS